MWAQNVVCFVYRWGGEGGLVFINFPGGGGGGKLKLESSRTAEVLSSAQTGPSLLAMAKSNGCARYKTINSLDLESRGFYPRLFKNELHPVLARKELVTVVSVP